MEEVLRQRKVKRKSYCRAMTRGGGLWAPRLLVLMFFVLRVCSGQATYRILAPLTEIPSRGSVYLSVSLEASVDVDFIVNIRPVESSTVWNTLRQTVRVAGSAGERLVSLRVLLRRELSRESLHAITLGIAPVGATLRSAYKYKTYRVRAVAGGCNPAPLNQFVSTLPCNDVATSSGALTWRFTSSAVGSGSLGGLDDAYGIGIGFSSFLPSPRDSDTTYVRSLIEIGSFGLSLRSTRGDWGGGRPLVNALGVPVMLGRQQKLVATVRLWRIHRGAGANEKFCLFLAMSGADFVRICFTSPASGRFQYLVEKVENGRSEITRSRGEVSRIPSSTTTMALRLIILSSSREVVLEYALSGSFVQHSRIAVQSQLLGTGGGTSLEGRPYLGISGSSGSRASLRWTARDFVVEEEEDDANEYRCTPVPSEFEGSPISTLPCSEVLITPPLALSFQRTAGELSSLPDARGMDTGLTAFLPSSSLSSSFNADKIRVRGRREVLEVESTPGDWEGDQQNNLINALGVLLPFPASDNVVNVSVLVPSDLSQTSGEKLCLYLAASDRDFVWICILAASSQRNVVLRFWQEEADERLFSTERTIYLPRSQVLNLSLRIRRNPNEVTVFYENGSREGAWRRVVRREISELLVNGDQASLDPEVGSRAFSGIVAASAPSAPQSAAVWTVSSFSVEEFIAANPSPGPPLPDSDDVDFDIWTIPNIELPTSMVYAPDGWLYVAGSKGAITGLRIDHIGRRVLQRRTYTGVTGQDRLLVGITVDPDWSRSAADQCLWISHASGLQNGSERGNSGIISKLCGGQFRRRTDVITGLPCADIGHSINNIRFGPDGRLYIASGGNTNAGSTNMLISAFYFPEQRLSAALLVADVKRQNFRGNCTPPQTRQEMELSRIATKEDAADCDVAVYASGLRNSFDMTFHPNGKIYAADNAVGLTGRRTFPHLPPGWRQGDSCSRPQSSPADITADSPSVREDLLHVVEEGVYYGHPNPSRDECVFFGGNPTARSDFRIPTSPVQEGATFSMEEPNYDVGVRAQRGSAQSWPFRPAMAGLGEGKSANSIISYRSSKFCGALNGDLLVTYFASTPQVRRISLSGDGSSVVRDVPLRRSTPATGGELLTTPLGIEQDPEGNLFIGQYRGTSITVMTAKDVSC